MASGHQGAYDTREIFNAIHYKTEPAASGPSNAVLDHGAALAIGVNLVQRNQADQGLVP